MSTEFLADKIKSLVEPLLQKENMNLVDIELKPGKGKHYLKIFIDKPGGVDIADCQNISKQLSRVLDVEDPIPNKFILEVSSPGLDRPLLKPADFIRALGKTVKIQLFEEHEGLKSYTGKVSQIQDDLLWLEVNQNQQISLPWHKISKGFFEIKF